MTQKILIFLFLVLLLGCSENTEIVKPNTQRNSQINPYDYYGIDHNNALDILYDYSGHESLTELEQIEIILSYFIDKYPNDDFDSPEDILDLMDELYDESLSITDKGDLLYSDGDLSSDQLEYFEDLDDIVNGYSILSEYDDAIDDLEETLSNDSNLTTNDKIIIWGLISVARHSAEYWYVEPDNGTSARKKPRPNGYTGTWIGEQTADAIGWINGFVNSSGHPIKSASAHAASYSRRYVDNHTPKD